MLWRCDLIRATAAPGTLARGLVDGYYHVLRVVDGDTVVLANVGRCRLADVDAAELDEPGGSEARDALARRINGRPVYVRFVRDKMGQPVHGYYGRPLIRLP